MQLLCTVTTLFDVLLLHKAEWINGCECEPLFERIMSLPFNGLEGILAQLVLQNFTQRLQWIKERQS